MKQEQPLHDATFNGIVTAAKSCTLYFTTTEGAGCSVTLHEVDALQMEDFRQGNIVILFETISGQTLNARNKLDRLYPGPHPSAAHEYHQQHEVLVRSRLAAIESGELTFVEMAPAYGADLLAVCKSITMQGYGAGRLMP